MIVLLLFTLIALAIAHSPSSLSTSQTLRLKQTRDICSRKVHCILNKEAMEGPFYVPHPLIRTNITEDRPGIPLSLEITVLNAKNCSVVPNAFVDIWHADAMGEYSGWATGSLLSSTSHLTARGTPIESSHWLRGVQATDDSGVARFNTVWPGWYRGRSTHIHLRIHSGNVTLSHGVFLGGERVAHTGQLFFADELVTEVSKTREPYVSRRKTLLPRMNGDDGIFVGSDGGDQIVDVQADEDVFHGSVTVGIDPESDHHESPMRPPHFGRPGRSPWRDFLAAVFGALIVVAVWALAKLFLRWRQARSGYSAVQLSDDDGAYSLTKPR
ncbi:aromatic compound dioxygenase [Glonium stellatum]|uniref:Aromatic compound dioxygenase n=1 Tax=Glonium stellatum TaxID=574774 RepID=A0A8E2F3S4_9PEZI|nr:aromatic compound dioxygenase [Glonium stellatum]